MKTFVVLASRDQIGGHAEYIHITALESKRNSQVRTNERNALTSTGSSLGLAVCAVVLVNDFKLFDAQL